MALDCPTVSCLGSECVPKWVSGAFLPEPSLRASQAAGVIAFLPQHPALEMQYHTHIPHGPPQLGTTGLCQCEGYVATSAGKAVQHGNSSTAMTKELCSLCSVLQQRKMLKCCLLGHSGTEMRCKDLLLEVLRGRHKQVLRDRDSPGALTIWRDTPEQ